MSFAVSDPSDSSELESSPLSDGSIFRFKVLLGTSDSELDEDEDVAGILESVEDDCRCKMCEVPVRSKAINLEFLRDKIR